MGPPLQEINKIDTTDCVGLPYSEMLERQRERMFIWPRIWPLASM